MNATDYANLALEMGAADAVPFLIEQIVFDSRTLLKCMYGCDDWGRNHTCPSRAGNPSMEQYKEMFSRYKWGIVIHAHEKALSQKVSFQMEDRAFKDGYYLAFSLSDCALCKRCAAATNEPCRNMKKARPAFHSVGIDVFKTVRQLGLPISTLSEPDQEEQNWYSAVFFE
ncbi:DUF2284 domain-containing protein [Eubacteriales bacterium OttesenSCG-928-N13]|nr:DUF2284 domain-containing protein [Eubacteriales bacterium OttesenSCG-928-N13]